MSRKYTVKYIQSKGIPAHVKKDNPFAFDMNILGSNIESGSLDDPWTEPPEEIYKMTCSYKDAPSTPTFIEIEFKDGIPVALDGKCLDSIEIMSFLNELAGKYGIGRVDMIEDRVVGIKSREIYEVPGYTILINAHRDLEALTLPPDVLAFKSIVEERHSNMVYEASGSVL